MIGKIANVRKWTLQHHAKQSVAIDLLKCVQSTNLEWIHEYTHIDTRVLRHIIRFHKSTVQHEFGRPSLTDEVVVSPIFSHF